jgi:hypothetical protein
MEFSDKRITAEEFSTIHNRKDHGGDREIADKRTEN